MKTQKLKELAQQATPWPWKWFTSNSHNRLSSVPGGKDGDVISAFKAADGAACVSISHDDMAFIEAVHPGVVIELIVQLEAAERANAAQDDHINQQQTRIDWLEAANSGLGKALCAAKSELARRDAAMGECAGVVTGYAVSGCVVSGNKLSIGDHVYTVAPPAVLPPVTNERDAFNNWNNEDNLPIAGVRAKNAAWLAWQARAALGAQQQKVVQLPAASVPHGWKLVPLKAFPSQWAAGQKAFDAAGINKIDPVYHAMVEAAPAPGGDDA